MAGKAERQGTINLADQQNNINGELTMSQIGYLSLLRLCQIRSDNAAHIAVKQRGQLSLLGWLSGLASVRSRATGTWGIAGERGLLTPPDTKIVDCLTIGVFC